MKQIIPFIFPILVIVLGFVIYRVLNFEPNFYTIVTNVGLAYILSPKYKVVEKQGGEEEQIKWLFLKKVINQSH